MLPGPPEGIGMLGLMVIIVGAGAVPPGPPTDGGVPGPIGVIVGPPGSMGLTGGGTGVPGTMGFTGVPPGEDGASAAILLVRKVTFALRAFNALGVEVEMPPAAGSISSSQAPHLRTEST